MKTIVCHAAGAFLFLVAGMMFANNKGPNVILPVLLGIVAMSAPYIDEEL